MAKLAKDNDSIICMAPPGKGSGGGCGSKTLIVIVMALVALSSAAFYYLRVDNYHLLTVEQGVLYRDGNQDMRRFTTALRQAQPKTIVPLIDAAELADPKKPQFNHEVTLAKADGLNLSPIPITLGGWPSTADVRQFLSIVENKANQPVLVHCAQGVRRTGMLVAAYQMSVLGWSKEKANQEIKTFGHSERTVADIREFIRIYDPATRTVTQTPPASVE